MMAGSLNKVMLIGNLGADPEVRYTKGDTAVANFRIATTDKWADKQGQKQERTEWHRIVAWGKLGENCGQFLAKGSSVYVEGSLETRKWQDRDGNDKYTTEIKAFKVTFLDSKKDSPAQRGDGGGQRRGQQQQRQSGGDQGGFDYGPPPVDDDIPF